MSESKSKKKAPKPKAVEAVPGSQPKKARPPKEDLCVFACRVAEAERIAFHKATGPAGASRFARRLMVVFAQEDVDGFKGLIEEARKLRS